MRVRRVARVLVEPLATERAAGGARRARLLAMVALANIAIALAAIVQTAIVGTSQGAQVVMPILSGAAAAFALVYGLARFGRTTASASVLVVTELGVPLLTGARLVISEFDSRFDPRSTAAWLVPALLTAGALLGVRGILAVGAVALAGVIVLAQYLGASALTSAEAAFFIFATTLLSFVYGRHRDGIELDRQQQLRSRNDALEDLRSTLEQRVVSRTAELEASTRELEGTNTTLHASQALLVQTEKMAAVGRLTAGIAHELASPLSAALAALDDIALLVREYARSIGDASVSETDHRAIAKDLGDATALARLADERAIKFVRGIRAHTRDPGPRVREPFVLGAVVAESVELLGHAARAANVRLVLEEPEVPLHMVGPPSRVNQVVTNLVKNAIDAIGELAERAPGRGLVTLRIGREGADAVITIVDDGPGMSPAVLARAFEPLFTTKAHGQGTGLGLSIVKEIVEVELGGSITVQTSEGSGATFVVRFPTHEASADGA